LQAGDVGEGCMAQAADIDVGRSFGHVTSSLH
jgi:hypothetical protein